MKQIDLGLVIDFSEVIWEPPADSAQA